MPRIQNENKTPIIEKKVYPDTELKTLDDELQKYLVTETLSNGSEVKVINFVQYHFDQHSMDEDGAVSIVFDEFGEVMQPIKYEIVEEKIRQWKRWKERKEYAKNRELKELQSIAEQMSVNPLTEGRG